MASVNLEKHSPSQSIGGIFRHNFRVTSNHQNKDINSELSQNNIHLGCSTYKEAAALYKSRLKECDELIPPKRIRQDRKTSLGLSIVAPRENMTEAEQIEFLKAAYDKLKTEFGDNVICGNIHVDERHEYRENDGSIHMSRAHLHVELLSWTDEKGVNMDAFYKRDLPIKLNKMMDEVCQERYGYSYQDGTRKRSRGKVEDLKAKESIELLKMNEQLKNENAELNNHNLLQKDFIDRQKTELRKQAAAIDEKAAELEKIETQLNTTKNERDELIAQLKDVNSLMEMRKKDLEKVIDAATVQLKKSSKIRKRKDGTQKVEMDWEMYQSLLDLQNKTKELNNDDAKLMEAIKLQKVTEAAMKGVEEAKQNMAEQYAKIKRENETLSNENFRLRTEMAQNYNNGFVAGQNDIITQLGKTEIGKDLFLTPVRGYANALEGLISQALTENEEQDYDRTK